MKLVKIVKYISAKKERVFARSDLSINSYSPGVRGPKPLPAVIAPGGVYGASGTYIFERPRIMKAECFHNEQFKNEKRRKRRMSFSTAERLYSPTYTHSAGRTP